MLVFVSWLVPHPLVFSDSAAVQPQHASSKLGLFPGVMGTRARSPFNTAAPTARHASVQPDGARV